MHAAQAACMAAALLLVGSLTPLPRHAHAASLSGDTGIAVLHSSPPAQGIPASVRAIPYVYADWDRWFARIDTVGVRTLDMGYGALELAGRLGQDGFDPAKAGNPALRERVSSVWFGMGTFQVTPYGGIFLHAFHDVRRSKGTWVDAVYAAQFDWAGAKIYPSLGLEWRDARYTRYYFSQPASPTTPTDQPGFSPTQAWLPKLGVLVDVPWANDWHLIAAWNVKWRPSSLSDSPLAGATTESTALLGAAYRWK